MATYVKGDPRFVDTPVMSDLGQRVAKKSGQQVNWHATRIAVAKDMSSMSTQAREGISLMQEPLRNCYPRQHRVRGG